jgi:Flp pilus assembly protein TadD
MTILQAPRISEPIPPAWDRSTALMIATSAAQRGEWKLASAELMKCPESALDDAACLNLLGLAAEVRGDWKCARKMYQRALQRDRSCQPAEQNLRRYFELFTFGRSHVPMCFAAHS